MDTPLQLLHGPYRSPPYRVGDTLTCAIRGRRLVVSTSDAPIPWPQTAARKYAGRRFHLVCGDLVRALRVESLAAIMHWWCVSQPTVSRWKRALGIVDVTEGTRQLLSAASRRYATARPCGWTAEDDAVLGTMCDRAAAAALGRTVYEVRKRRYRLGIANHQGRVFVPPHTWTADEDALLGTMPDRRLAARLGISPLVVTKRRWKLGIPRCPGPGGRPRRSELPR